MQDIKTDFYDEFLKHPEVADKNNSHNIEFKESIILGIALSINNVGLGIGVSIIGLNPYLSSILSIIFSLIFIQAGFYIGDSFLSSLFKRYATLISGIIIVFLGFYTLFH
jgi:putative sporulation protein YtaF